jgi:hypothetical protein
LGKSIDAPIQLSNGRVRFELKKGMPKPIRLFVAKEFEGLFSRETMPAKGQVSFEEQPGLGVYISGKYEGREVTVYHYSHEKNKLMPLRGKIGVAGLGGNCLFDCLRGWFCIDKTELEAVFSGIICDGKYIDLRQAIARLLARGDFQVHWLDSAKTELLVTYRDRYIRIFSVSVSSSYYHAEKYTIKVDINKLTQIASADEIPRGWVGAQLLQGETTAGWGLILGVMCGILSMGNAIGSTKLAYKTQWEWLNAQIIVR